MDLVTLMFCSQLARIQKQRRICVFIYLVVRKMAFILISEILKRDRMAFVFLFRCSVMFCQAAVHAPTAAVH